MKTQPYTYTKLIRGAAFAYNYHAFQLDKTKDSNEKLYHLSQMSYFQNEIHRMRLIQRVCGNNTAIVR